MKTLSMRKLTRLGLWLFVFSVPWGIMNSVLGLASITRFLGIGAVGLGIVTSVLDGRIRRPGAIFWAALIFVMSTQLSQLWSISYAATAEQANTYVQLVAVIWLLGEFIRTREQLESMMRAFWLGAFVVAIDLLWNFQTGTMNTDRYTATNFNPNYIGFTLAMGFPMAWRQLLIRRGAVRVAAASFCVIAPLTILLTASRSAIMAGLIGLAIVPLMMRRPSRTLIPVAAGLVLTAVLVGSLVPRQTWDRILSTKSEIESGYLGGRGDVWAAGWIAFQERPVLGSGTSTYRVAITPLVRRDAPGHNMVLTLLVDQGLVGLSLFLALLAACVWAIVHLGSDDRKMWIVMMLGWFVMTMAHDAHVDKVTWVMFGLLTAQRGLSPAGSRATSDESSRSAPSVGDGLVPHPHRV
jgi:O-antigen ligase